MIEVKESSRSSVKFKRLTGGDAPTVLVPKWLERDKNALKGTVVQMPAREDHRSARRGAPDRRAVLQISQTLIPWILYALPRLSRGA